MTHIAQGSFTVQATREPPYDEALGVSIGRTHLEKSFEGDLIGTSQVEMLGAMTETKGSAAYVAIERVKCILQAREGSFVLHHTGVMNRGAMSLTIQVVPDSGSGALAGIAGSFRIDITGGKHFYTFEYTLPE
jgi:Protein of unknown function (DUF3224)